MKKIASKLVFLLLAFVIFVPKKNSMSQLLSHSLRALTLLCLCLSVGSCQHPRAQHTSEQATATDSTTLPARFPYPDIPPVLVSPSERAAYLLRHYWERFDFADTTLLHQPEITEQGVVDFLDLLATQVPPETAKESLQAFCRLFATHDQARRDMPELVKKYLYESNSPLHNEPLFATFLAVMNQESALQNDPARSRWTFLQELVGRNNPGQKASDFVYYTPDDKRHTLYHTPGKLTLLFFYDPQCENCHRTLLGLKASRELTEAAASGEICVLAVYTENDEETWRATLNELPATWLTATDRGKIQTDALYDLKAMPSLYLLDASKKVILKDAPFEEIFTYLGFPYM